MNVDSQYIVADQMIMSEAKNYFLWQYNLVAPFIGKQVLEIGCGIGNFTAFLADRNCRVLALDIDEECIRFHQRRFAHVDHVKQLTLDAMSSEIERTRGFEPDTIICLNVLEHIQDDAKALAGMFDVLAPSGKVCLLVPAYETLRGPIDNAVGHYRRYNKAHLRQISLDAGFRIERLNYMNAIGFFAWWLNSKVFKRTRQSSFQVKTFDRFIVPFLSRLEKVVTLSFGQNIFAVLVKPDVACETNNGLGDFCQNSKKNLGYMVAR